MGFLFLRVPLWNPDAFLDRTVGLAKSLFSRPAFLFWALLLLSAGVILIRRWGELTEPLQGLLAAGNLPLMWITLVVLKVFHEFGHAYACKHYGGQVPEMGAYLIVFTPCAYMDATASWGFTSKRERLMEKILDHLVEKNPFDAPKTLVASQEYQTLLRDSRQMSMMPRMSGTR